MAGRLFVRGDSHGNFDFLPYFCEEYNTDKEDFLIVLGDAGILYFGEDNKHERALKNYIGQHPITIVCVRGNHEERPGDRNNMCALTYLERPNLSGPFKWEAEFPNILYTIDGKEYHFGDKTALVIGGAYSVDKWYRLRVGYNWFENEELTDEEMDNIIFNIRGKSYDFVLTHTCPYEWMPTDLFLSSVDQNTISNRTERFLSEVKRNCNWGSWWFGHFHANRVDMRGDGRVNMLYDDIVELEL